VPQPSNREGALCGPPGGGCDAGLECSTSPVFRLCFAPADLGGRDAPCGVSVAAGNVAVDPCAPGFVCDAAAFTCQPGDADGDGLDDASEVLRGTSPNDVDSDDDGLCDGPRGVGCVAGEDVNANGVVDATETDPRLPDTDCDGLDDGAERSPPGTNARQSDSDFDGLPDGLERGSSLSAPGCPVIPGDANPLTTTNAVDADSDDDGFCDGAVTIPMVCVAGEDTNGNGAVDGGESDPNDGASTP